MFHTFTIITIIIIWKILDSLLIYIYVCVCVCVQVNMCE